MKQSELPDPVRDDAPDRTEFDHGDTVETVRHGLCAVDFDGGRYCMDCANPEYVEMCRGDPREIPYGGPVPDGAEVDCPGHACDHCFRRIERMTILHYGDVCHPESCPEMDDGLIKD